ncbi:phage protein [Brevibacillus agri BAB-2500]|nr:phage protein [Brevibacillus agri BAB-2500]
MKTDIKTEVRTALLNNASLVSLLGGQRIYQLAAPNATEYPRITFFEVTNYVAAFADDVPIMADVIVQVNIWSKDSTSAIAGEVDETMKAQGWSRTSAADLYEEDTKVYHKAVRYRRQFEED